MGAGPDGERFAIDDGDGRGNLGYGRSANDLIFRVRLVGFGSRLAQGHAHERLTDQS